MTAHKQPHPSDERARLMTVQEVAAELNVRVARVYELIKAGELPAIRLGEQQIRIRRSRLEAWLEQNDTTRAAAAAAGR